MFCSLAKWHILNHLLSIQHQNLFEKQILNLVLKPLLSQTAVLVAQLQIYTKIIIYKSEISHFYNMQRKKNFAHQLFI